MACIRCPAAYKAYIARDAFRHLPVIAKILLSLSFGNSLFIPC